MCIEKRNEHDYGLGYRLYDKDFRITFAITQSNGDLSRPVGGAQGRLRSERLWDTLTHSLNAIGNGSTKTTKKWKKVWADLKSKTKKKGLRIRLAANGTGGGPHDGQSLSALDLRVLAIMGLLAVQGQEAVQELGFTNINLIERPVDIQAEPANIEQIFVNEYSHHHHHNHHR
ncbi:uncharacterized protein LOC121740269 isoform X1 [Aricia agestis]|uniref:uncharacterized protein LOC121728413 isoform X1 n=1 Tax=Aricia agestis TaxID=91739 RepID=UPI001C20289E|nr:uncharacterized protein LOC121728413 isoform X1 [Aricia agestis]XP_041988856.1 uncharacterized protein LOC121740269 isoform X1 [Aricia agestis]